MKIRTSFAPQHLSSRRQDQEMALPLSHLFSLPAMLKYEAGLIVAERGVCDLPWTILGFRPAGQDWYKDSQTKIVVRSTVEQVLHKMLPASYDRALFKQKCDRVLDVMLDYASHGRKWAA